MYSLIAKCRKQRRSEEVPAGWRHRIRVVLLLVEEFVAAVALVCLFPRLLRGLPLLAGPEAAQERMQAAARLCDDDFVSWLHEDFPMPDSGGRISGPNSTSASELEGTPLRRTANADHGRRAIAVDQADIERGADRHGLGSDFSFPHRRRGDPLTVRASGGACAAEAEREVRIWAGNGEPLFRRVGDAPQRGAISVTNASVQTTPYVARPHAVAPSRETLRRTTPLRPSRGDRRPAFDSPLNLSRSSRRGPRVNRGHRVWARELRANERVVPGTRSRATGPPSRGCGAPAAVGAARVENSNKMCRRS